MKKKKYKMIEGEIPAFAGMTKTGGSDRRGREARQYQVVSIKYDKKIKSQISNIKMRKYKVVSIKYGV